MVSAAAAEGHEFSQRAEARTSAGGTTPDSVFPDIYAARHYSAGGLCRRLMGGHGGLPGLRAPTSERKGQEDSVQRANSGQRKHENQC